MTDCLEAKMRKSSIVVLSRMNPVCVMLVRKQG